METSVKQKLYQRPSKLHVPLFYDGVYNVIKTNTIPTVHCGNRLEGYCGDLINSPLDHLPGMPRIISHGRKSFFYCVIDNKTTIRLRDGSDNMEKDLNHIEEYMKSYPTATAAELARHLIDKYIESNDISCTYIDSSGFMTWKIEDFTPRNFYS